MPEQISYEQQRLDAYNRINPDFVEGYMSQVRDAMRRLFGQIYPGWTPDQEPQNAKAIGIKVLYDVHLSDVERALKGGVVDGATGLAFLDEDSRIALEES